MRSSDPQRATFVPVIWLAMILFLLQLPFLSRGVSFYDEGSILAIAEGLSRGDALYRDRVTNMGPLIYELMGAAMRLFGPHIMLGRILQAAIFIGCGVAIFQILRDLVSARAAWLGAFAFMAIKGHAFPFWTLVNYSQLAMLVTLWVIVWLKRFLETERALPLLLAGIGIGTTVMTKQNQAGFLALAAALAICAHAWQARSGLARLTRDGTIGIVGSLIPILPVVVAYAIAGNLDDMIERAVFGLQYMPAHYRVPFPTLASWLLEPDSLGVLMLTYFPPALVHLAWQGDLNINVESPATVAILEVVIKSVYYAPLLAFPLALRFALDPRDRHRIRAEAPFWILLAVLSATAYSSLYRADWTHLMNVYPLMLLFLAAVIARWSETSQVGRGVGLSLFAAWVGTGIFVGWAAIATFDTPIESARGRVLAPKGQAEYAALVLEREAQMRDRTVMFVRADALFYFLTGRKVPTPIDLMLPGIFLPGDDAVMRESLREVDALFYNPSMLPSIPTPVTEFIPETAAYLARNFRISDVIEAAASVDAVSHATSLLVDRITPAVADSEVVIDVWSQSDALEPGEFAVARGSWLMYRVLIVDVTKRAPARCFSLLHGVDAGQSLSFLSMTPPRAWRSEPGTDSVAFEVFAAEGSGGRELLYSQTRSTSAIPVQIRLPLDAYAGREISIQFCVRAADAFSAESTSVGWGEVQILEKI